MRVWACESIKVCLLSCCSCVQACRRGFAYILRRHPAQVVVGPWFPAFRINISCFELERILRDLKGCCWCRYNMSCKACDTGCSCGENCSCGEDCKCVTCAKPAAKSKGCTACASGCSCGESCSCGPDCACEKCPASKLSS